MNNIILFYTINLNNYIVNIYYADTDVIPDNIITDTIQPIVDILNNEQYPSGIVEKLESQLSCKKIDIFDLNNTLLLSSARFEP